MAETSRLGVDGREVSGTVWAAQTLAMSSSADFIFYEHKMDRCDSVQRSYSPPRCVQGRPRYSAFRRWMRRNWRGGVRTRWAAGRWIWRMPARGRRGGAG